MILPASYQSGFAPRDGEPLYPELWKGCVFAAEPCLGPSGLVLRDWSGFGNHSVLTNGATWGVRGGRQAISFDGANDYGSLSIAPYLNLTGEMTIAVWLNAATVASGARGIVGDSNSAGTTLQWAMDINRTAGRIGWVHGGSTYMIVTANTTLVENQWYHAVAVRTGSSGAWIVTFYLNGVRDGSATGTVNPTLQQGASIGRFGAYNGAYFSGGLGGIRIYNVALSPNQIQLLASRRGIAHELAPVRYAGESLAAYTRRLQHAQLIGGGLIG